MSTDSTPASKRSLVGGQSARVESTEPVTLGIDEERELGHDKNSSTTTNAGHVGASNGIAD
jgi:hypothetical protein